MLETPRDYLLTTTIPLYLISLTVVLLSLFEASSLWAPLLYSQPSVILATSVSLLLRLHILAPSTNCYILNVPPPH